MTRRTSAVHIHQDTVVCSPGGPPEARPRRRKLVVAVDEDGTGAVYSTRGSPRFGFTTVSELLEAIARCLAVPHPGTLPNADCRCSWTGFMAHSCGRVGLVCGNCGAAWCPCQGSPVTTDPLAVVLDSWRAGHERGP